MYRFVCLLLVGLMLCFSLPARAAAMGEQCQLGANVAPQYLCPFGSKCLKSISNYYCSAPLSVCGWGGTSGAGLGELKTYNGNSYECFWDGFHRVYLIGDSCSSNSQCQSGYCGGGSCQTPPAPEPLTAQQIIQTMVAAGAGLDDIIVAVMDAKNLTAEAVIAMLQAMFDTQQRVMLAALTQAMPDAESHHYALWLLGGGYEEAQVADALRHVLDLSWNGVVQALAWAGVSAQNIVLAVRELTTEVKEKAMAVALRSADVGLQASHWAIMQGYGIGSIAAAKAVAAAGWSRGQLLDLMTYIGASKAQAAEVILEVAGPKQEALRAALIDLRQWAQSTAQYTREQLEASIAAAQLWAAGVVDAVLDELYGTAPPMLLAAPSDWDRWAAVAADATMARGTEWLRHAYLDEKHCKVMAVSAIGTPGVLKSRLSFAGPVAAALRRAGASVGVASGWDEAMSDAWNAWASQVMIPGLPLYPAFAAWPGAAAPPMPNVPFPLATMPSANMSELVAPPRLAQRVRTELGRAVGSNRDARVAIDRFSKTVAAHFSMCLASCQVMMVMGRGPVPSFAPPTVPAGPVVKGICSGGLFPCGQCASVIGGRLPDRPQKFGLPDREALLDMVLGDARTQQRAMQAPARSAPVQKAPAARTPLQPSKPAAKPLERQPTPRP